MSDSNSPKAPSDLPQLAPRDRDGHKGSYGRVLVVGGSREMPGAVALASGAALRGGAGLVTFAAPGAAQSMIAPMCPCATSVRLTCDEQGRPAPEAVAEVMSAAKRCDVLAVGPGMGVGTHRAQVVRACLEGDRPVVLDADGLNNLATMDDWPAWRRCPLVLTPHPGEFSRLTGRSVKEIQGDRENAAGQAASRWVSAGATDAPLVVVLKGAGTVVSNGSATHVNPTGNPGMASGGSGDVLTGLTAALIGQGMALMDAARLGAYVHGLAGDIAADRWGETSMIATDLIDAMGEAFQRSRGE